MEIVSGVGEQSEIITSRRRIDWYPYRNLSKLTQTVCQCDVLIDCAPAEVFEEILMFAILRRVPYMSLTAGLSEAQLDMLRDARVRIPVFRDQSLDASYWRMMALDETVQELLEAAKVLTKCPVRRDEFYNLRRLRGELM